MKLMIAGLMLAFAVMLSGCAEEEPEANQSERTAVDDPDTVANESCAPDGDTLPPDCDGAPPEFPDFEPPATPSF